MIEFYADGEIRAQSKPGGMVEVVAKDGGIIAVLTPSAAESLATSLEVNAAYARTSSTSRLVSREEAYDFASRFLPREI